MPVYGYTHISRHISAHLPAHMSAHMSTYSTVCLYICTGDEVEKMEALVAQHVKLSATIRESLRTAWKDKSEQELAAAYV